MEISVKNNVDTFILAQLFVSERKQIAFMVDGKLPVRIFDASSRQVAQK